MAWPSRDDNPLPSEAFLSFHEFDACWVPFPVEATPAVTPTCKGGTCKTPSTCGALSMCLVKRLA